MGTWRGPRVKHSNPRNDDISVFLLSLTSSFLVSVFDVCSLNTYGGEVRCCKDGAYASTFLKEEIVGDGRR